jgi:hypothetical protein
MKISRKIKDENVLEKLSINKVVSEKIRLYESFIHQNEKLYLKFLKDD